MVGSRDAAGFVLVGGRSSRMGQDKALLPFQGAPLALHIASQLYPVVDSVAFIGDPEKYRSLGTVIPDEFPHEGPVGGIVTALRASRSNRNLIVACDLPGVRPETFARLLEILENSAAQCIVPVTPDGRQQVLCAAYTRDALDPLERAILDGERRLTSAIRRLRVEFSQFEGSGWAVNVNTPADWEPFLQER